MVKKKNSDVNPFSHGENAEVWLEEHADRIPDLVSTASAAAATSESEEDVAAEAAAAVGLVIPTLSASEITDLVFYAPALPRPEATTRDRWERDVPNEEGNEDPVLFMTINDHELIAKVTDDPLSFKAYV